VLECGIVRWYDKNVQFHLGNCWEGDFEILTIEEVQLGEHDQVKSTWEYHLVACTYAWQKVTRAVVKQKPLNEWSSKFAVAEFCGDHLLGKGELIRDTMVALNERWYPRCGLDDRRMLGILDEIGIYIFVTVEHQWISDIGLVVFPTILRTSTGYGFFMSTISKIYLDKVNHASQIIRANEKSSFVVSSKDLLNSITCVVPIAQNAAFHRRIQLVDRPLHKWTYQTPPQVCDSQPTYELRQNSDTWVLYYPQVLRPGHGYPIATQSHLYQTCTLVIGE